MDEELQELVASMTAQGASDDDIVAALQERGYNVQPNRPQPAAAGRSGSFADTLRAVAPQQTAMGRAPVASDASAQVGVPQRARRFEPTPVTDMSGAARTLAQGLTFGWADELEGLGRATVMGEDYETARTEAENDMLRYRESNPVTAFGLEMAGGIGTGGAGLKMGAKALGRAGEAVTRSTARKVATGIGAGIGGGAAAGAGSAGPGRRGAGAAVGGTIGGMLPGMGSAIGAAGRRVKNVIPGLNRIGASEGANVRILRAILQDETTPPELRTQAVQLFAKGAKPETLLELAGPNVRGLGDLVTNMPGRGAKHLTNVLEDRQKGAVGRLKHDARRIADEALDADGVPLPMTDLARESTDEFADLYKQAWMKTGNMPPIAELQPYMTRPSARDAWKRATKSLRDKGRKVKPLYNADGTLARRPSLVEFDAWKRALDDMTEDPALIERGGLSRSDMATITGDIRKPAVDMVDERIPEYADARQKAGDFIRAERAGKRAEGTLRGAPSFLQDDAGELAGDFRSFADPEKAMYRTGAVRDIGKNLDNARTMDMGSRTNYAARVYGTPNQQAKVRTIAPDGVGDEVIDLAQREVGMFNTLRDLTTGSQTFKRQAARADQDGLDALGFMTDIATGSPGATTARGISGLLKAGKEASEGFNEPTRFHIGKRLGYQNVGGDAGGTPLMRYLDDLESWRTGYNQNYYRGRGRVGGASSIFGGSATEQR